MVDKPGYGPYEYHPERRNEEKERRTEVATTARVRNKAVLKSRAVKTGIQVGTRTAQDVI